MPSEVVTANSIVANKLQGIQGLRYGLEFHIVVNATRFASGRYGMYFVYTGGSEQQNAGPWFNAHARSFVQRSQLPHVEFDLACDTSATLKIPWVNSLLFTPLSTFTKTVSNVDTRVQGDLGFFFIAPVTNNTQLRPSTESAKFTIYYRFTDITLVGASSIPQMDAHFEAKSKNAGPVESMAKKISRLSNVMGRVPLLSAFAGTTKWAADITADAASVFGFSKPTNDSTHMRVKRKPIAGVANVDSLDNSDHISLFTTNQVANDPSFSGTEVDELDLSSFVQRWTMLLDSNWIGTNLSGDVLYDLSLSPGAMTRTSLVGSETVYDHSHMAYISSLFEYWRGSLVFRFTFVKTEFHSGRIEISFLPVYNDNSTGTVVPEFLHRDIVDIRYNSTITLKIPYTSPANYLPTGWSKSSGYGRSFGRLQVRVLDPLVNPTSVSSTVPILVEVCAGDDLEFAYPRQIEQVCVSGLQPQMNDCSITEKMIGNTQSKPPTLAYANSSIGEKITSMRQLLKRFTSTVNRVTPVNGSTPPVPLTGNRYEIRPFVVTWAIRQTPVGDLYTSQTPDLFSQLGAMFALYRGGVRIKYVNNVNYRRTVGSDTFKPIGMAYLDVMNTSGDRSEFTMRIKNSTTTALGSSARNNIIYFNPIEEYGVEVAVPQYSITQALPTASLRCSVQQTTGGGSPSTIVEGQWPLNNIIPTSYQPSVTIFDGALPTYTLLAEDPLRPYVMRAGSEDSNFGCFVSIPGMVRIFTLL